MKHFTGMIRTDKVGSECEFEFEAENDATDEEIEQEAREAAFNCIEWNYEGSKIV